MWITQSTYGVKPLVIGEKEQHIGVRQTITSVYMSNRFASYILNYAIKIIS